MPTGTTRPNRGCGQRVRGGVYACCGLSPFGKPIEDFLIDPAIKIDTGPFRTPQLFKRDGVNHVLIWVGEQFYPSATDFIEETRQQGISRRFPSTFDFSKLSPGSLMYFVHRNAQVKDHQKITAALELMGITSLCPKRIKSHATPRAEVPCLGLNYPLASLLPGTTFDTEDADGRERDVAIREVGDTRYVVPDAHKLKEKAEYEIGIFGAFPIANLEYVKGENGEMDPDVVNSISQTSIKVVFCDD